MQRGTALTTRDVGWQAKAAEGSLQFVYLVGVEGSNHHGVMSELLAPLSLSQRCKPDSAKHGNNATMCIRPDAADEFRTFIGGDVCDKTPTRETILANMNVECNICVRDAVVRNALFHGDIEVDEVVSRGSQCGGTILEDMSFPSGSSRTPPGPMNLSSMFRQLSGRIDTRLVVLQRDFYDTVMSHQWFDGGANRHAKKMVEYMEYISQTLKGLPSHAWRILPVDCISTNKHGLQTSLARFLGFPTEECGHCWEHWNTPASNAARRAQRRTKVDDAFTKNRHRFDVLDPVHAKAMLSQYLVDPMTCNA